MKTVSEKQRQHLKRISNMPRSLRGGGYDALHKWLRRHYGKADKCENLDCPGDEKRYHWALIKGKEYEYKRENFMMLGGKCHRNYDLTPEMREVLRHSKDKYKKLIGQFSRNGILVERWEGLNEVARCMSFNKGNLSQVLAGKRKTAHNFIWRYL